MFFEFEEFELEHPSQKVVLCPDCQGDPASIRYREWVTCRACDGEGCLGIAQCHTCGTDGRILEERRGCPSCKGRGTEMIYLEGIDDSVLTYFERRSR